MRMVCMVLGEKCNWSCSYCDRPRIKQPKDCDLDLLTKYYPKIVKWIGDTPLHISGGETALINKNCLDYIFSFDKKLIVETNGLWFDKDYHNLYKIGIEKIVYHCVPDLNFDIKHKQINDQVEYLIVIHHENIKMLENFIDKNGVKKWVFQLFYTKVPTDIHLNLTKDDYMFLMKNFPNNVNVAHLLKRYIYMDNKELLDDLRETCFREMNFIGIDFVNGRIKLCKQSHSYTAYIDLNDRNFNQLISEKLINKEPIDEICQQCLEMLNNFTGTKRKK
jgi:organic radical activating enzyme